MNVLNVHERTLLTSRADVWRLLANLGSKHELLWPKSWPAVGFDRPLGLGAAGGHGPIGYYVEDLVPGESIRFRLTAPRGFEGYHEFRILPQLGSLTFRHTLRVRMGGLAALYWVLLLRPLHDALLQDLMDRVSTYSSGHPFSTRWSVRVRFTRVLLRRIGGQGRGTPTLAPPMRSHH